MPMTEQEGYQLLINQGWTPEQINQLRAKHGLEPMIGPPPAQRPFGIAESRDISGAPLREFQYSDVPPRSSYLGRMKERAPELVGGIVGGAVGAATFGPDPTDLITVPAAYSGAARLASAIIGAGAGGASGIGWQEAAKMRDPKYRPESLAKITRRQWKAAKEEMGTEAISILPFMAARKLAKPFIKRTWPGAPRLSEKLSAAAQRMPEERLAELPPKIRKAIKKKTFLSLGAQTEIPSVDWLENAVAGSILGGGKIYRLKNVYQPRAYRQLMDEMVESLWQDAAKRSPTEVGQLFLDAITGAKEVKRLARDAIYNQVWEQIGDVRVSMQGPKRLAQLLQKKYGVVADNEAGKAILHAIKQVADQPGSLSVREAKTVRSFLLKSGRKLQRDFGSTDPELSRAFNQLSASIQQQMRKAGTKASPIATKLLQRADQMTRIDKQFFDQKMFKRAMSLAKENPEKVAAYFFRPHAVKQAQRLRQAVGQDTFKIMRASWIEQVIEQAARRDEMILGPTFERAIKNLGPEMQKEIFTRTMQQNIDDLIELRRFIKGPIGRSGGGMVVQLAQAGAVLSIPTGLIAGTASLTGGGATILITPEILAHLMSNRHFIRLLTEGVQRPRTGRALLPLFYRIRRMVKTAQEEKGFEKTAPKAELKKAFKALLPIRERTKELVTGIPLRMKIPGGTK